MSDAIQSTRIEMDLHGPEGVFTLAIVATDGGEVHLYFDGEPQPLLCLEPQDARKLASILPRVARKAEAGR